MKVATSIFDFDISSLRFNAWPIEGLATDRPPIATGTRYLPYSATFICSGLPAGFGAFRLLCSGRLPLHLSLRIL
jgi:hypothetical protein